MKRRILFVAGTTLLASAAYANPYATEVLRARLVPGPHVQLTYGKSSSVYPLKDTPTPVEVNTHGTASTFWSTKTITYNTNTGSGVVPVSALQMCDCNVPDGQTLQYTIKVPNLGTEGQFNKFSASTAVRVPPPTVGDAGLAKWDIPDPTEVQGLDCSAACASDAHPTGDAAVPAPDAALPALDASAPSTTTGTETATNTGTANAATATATGTALGSTEPTGTGTATSQDPAPKTSGGGGACSTAPGGRPAGIASLLLLAALAILRRRRGTVRTVCQTTARLRSTHASHGK